jgi:hypothetical protein
MSLQRRSVDGKLSAVQVCGLVAVSAPTDSFIVRHVALLHICSILVQSMFIRFSRPVTKLSIYRVYAVLKSVRDGRYGAIGTLNYLSNLVSITQSVFWQESALWTVQQKRRAIEVPMARCRTRVRTSDVHYHSPG